MDRKEQVAKLIRVTLAVRNYPSLLTALADQIDALYSEPPEGLRNDLAALIARYGTGLYDFGEYVTPDEVADQILSLIYPKQKCKVCGGSGKVVISAKRTIGYTLTPGENIDEHLEVCSHCSGTGFEPEGKI